MVGAASKEKEVIMIFVGLALVLAIDVSGSMDDAEWKLEKLGYVQAFRDPSVARAIFDRTDVAITVVEWSNTQQVVVVPWRILKDASSTASFASEVASIGRVPMPANTSLRRAIAFSTQLLEDAPFAADRRVIDISGDGPESFPDGLPLRGEALKKGITINGLPIRSKNLYPRDIERYYRDNVIGGPGAFYVVANGYEDFARAILKKLILELVADATTECRSGLSVTPLLQRDPRHAADRCGDEQSSLVRDLEETLPLRPR